MSTKELIIDFLEWMNEVAQEQPSRLETDNDDIAAMYLSADRPIRDRLKASMEADTLEQAIKIVSHKP